MKVLLVEDDPAVSGFVSRGMKEAGHAVDLASDGREGLFLATSESYDVVVLDRMLPILDGLTVLKSLRSSGLETPVLILSTMDQVNDKVDGLRNGADDYLAKPFSFVELLARVEVLYRRQASGGSISADTTLQVHDLSMDLLARKVKRGGAEIELHAKEFALLEYLMRHEGHVVSRTMLLEQVWDYHFDPQTNVIEVHVSRIRSKIDKAFPDRLALLSTVRGMGYRLGEPKE